MKCCDNTCQIEHQLERLVEALKKMTAPATTSKS